jgi:hypothetical protein
MTPALAVRLTPTGPSWPPHPDNGDDGEQASNTERFAEQQQAGRHRATGADAGPDRVGDAKRQDFQRLDQQCAATVWILPEASSEVDAATVASG